MAVHGFDHGDRVVRDTGEVGEVRIFELSADDRAEGCAEAEVAWQGSFVADELDADLARRLRRA